MRPDPLTTIPVPTLEEFNVLPEMVSYTVQRHEQSFTAKENDL